LTLSGHPARATERRLPPPDEKTITIKLRRSPLLGADVPSCASDEPSDSAVELTAAVAFTRRGAETILIFPVLAQQNHRSGADQGDCARACVV
jgi:hypothetical protein